ncbi:16S rRNA (cytidine(1402)-2'-O)-methyltransferase [Mycoplasma sp. 4044]
MENKLYIVGTPIGNLEDISYRAVRILKEVDLILCEDTRTSKPLLKHYEIYTPTSAYHNFNEKTFAPKVLQMIQDNKSVALISDAGMPAVSDPGFEIVRLCKQNDVDVEVIGGPTALIHAFIKANFSSTFSFIGFLKDKSQQRINYFKTLSPNTYISYVSPHKLIATLNDFDVVFGDNIELYLIKEMTKKFEASYQGSPKQVLEQLQDNTKGEFVLVFNIPEVKKEKVNKYAHLKNVS